MGIGLGVMAVGCDMLEMEPTSVITSNSFWKTESDAEGALAGMYVQLRNNAVENLFIWGEMRSETLESEAIVGDNYLKYRENDLDASFGPTWQNFYSAVSPFHQFQILSTRTYSSSIKISNIWQAAFATGVPGPKMAATPAL